ncbi:MAG: thioredoxin family protein [Candidatus Omnitrophota bacterium]
MTKLFKIVVMLLVLTVSALVPQAHAAVSWTGDFNGALKEAKAKGVPVMVDFYTDWCKWCKKLDRDTYSDQKVAGLSERFVCVKVNGDKNPEIAAKYGVDGYPSIFFLDAGGNAIGKIVGYVNADEMAMNMDRALSKYGAVRQQESSRDKDAAESKGKNWKTGISDWWKRISRTADDKSPATKEVVEAPQATTETVYCDVLILDNGSKVQGTIESQDGDNYVLRLPLGKTTIDKSRVREVRKFLPEEASVLMGDKYYQDKNYDAAIEEYRKALRIKPDYKPAKISLESAVSNKAEEIEKQKAEKKEALPAEREAEGPDVTQEPLPSFAKRVNFGFNIMNRESIKRKYDYRDFGFSVDDNLIVNGFYAKDCSSCKPVYPAQEAGLRSGDRIVSINGISTNGLTASEATKLIGSHRYSLFVIERQ